MPAVRRASWRSVYILWQGGCAGTTRARGDGDGGGTVASQPPLPLVPLPTYTAAPCSCRECMTATAAYHARAR